MDEAGAAGTSACLGGFAHLKAGSSYLVAFAFGCGPCWGYKALYGVLECCSLTYSSAYASCHLWDHLPGQMSSGVEASLGEVLVSAKAEAGLAVAQSSASNRGCVAVNVEGVVPGTGARWSPEELEVGLGLGIADLVGSVAPRWNSSKGFCFF